MAYRLDIDRPVGDEVRRVFAECLDQSVRHLRVLPEPGPDDIHQARVGLKRARALLRLVRDDLGDTAWKSADRRLRDAGRALAGVRDADVVGDTFEHLLGRLDWSDRPTHPSRTRPAVPDITGHEPAAPGAPGTGSTPATTPVAVLPGQGGRPLIRPVGSDPLPGGSAPEVPGLRPDTVARIRAALASDAAAARQGARHEGGPAAVADDLDAALLSTTLWSVHDAGFDALASGYRRQYGRGREALHGLGRHPTADDMHELRKRVKDHWHHLRLIRDAWPGPMKALAKEAKVLSERLGDDHDLAVLRFVLTERHAHLLGPDDAPITDAIDRERDRLLVLIRADAERLYADTPKAATRRLAHWWSVASA